MPIYRRSDDLHKVPKMTHILGIAGDESGFVGVRSGRDHHVQAAHTRLAPRA